MLCTVHTIRITISIVMDINSKFIDDYDEVEYSS